MISQNTLINLIIIISSILLFIILYFMKICYPYSENKCYLNGLITLPKDRFATPLSKNNMLTILDFLFDIEFPYIWILFGLMTSYIVIIYRPKNEDKKVNHIYLNEKNLN